MDDTETILDISGVRLPVTDIFTCKLPPIAKAMSYVSPKTGYSPDSRVNALIMLYMQIFRVFV